MLPGRATLCHAGAPDRGRHHRQSVGSVSPSPYRAARKQPRRERPGRRSAKQRGHKFSPSDVGCHATLPLGVMPMQRRGRYHALSERRIMLLRCESLELKPESTLSAIMSALASCGHPAANAYRRFVP